MTKPELQETPSDREGRIVAESEPLATLGDSSEGRAMADDEEVTTDSEPLESWHVDCSKRQSA